MMQFYSALWIMWCATDWVGTSCYPIIVYPLDSGTNHNPKTNSSIHYNGVTWSTYCWFSLLPLDCELHAHLPGNLSQRLGDSSSIDCQVSIEIKSDTKVEEPYTILEERKDQVFTALCQQERKQQTTTNVKENCLLLLKNILAICP